MNDWYFPRTELAEKYLQILETGIFSSIAIIAPRRKGKTLFALKDIFDLARQKHYIPVYASLWQNINAPHQGLISALEEAINAADKKNAFSRLLKTKIKKASLNNDLIGQLEVEFADSPKQPTNDDLTLIDKLLTQLQHKAKNKTVLLIIDEVQHLATSSQFDALTHTLRTSLDKRQGQVKAIFTGSSRHYMNLLINDKQSPFYHFVELVPFPELGDEFLAFLSSQLHQHYGIAVPKEAMQKAFSAVDHSPYWMMKIISHIITFENDIDNALNYVLQLMEAAEGFDQIAKQMKPVDKIVFLALSDNKSPFSEAVLKQIDDNTSVKGVYSNVQRSLQRLIEKQLVSQKTKGEYVIEKPGLKRYLLGDD